MRLAVIGAPISALDDRSGLATLPLRGPDGLEDWDAVLLDAEAATCEYAPQIERDGTPPVLSIAGGNHLLRDLRRWRETLRTHLADAGLVVALVGRLPSLGVHTLDRVQAWNALAALPVTPPTAVPLDAADVATLEVRGGEPYRAFAAALAPLAAPSVALQGDGAPLMADRATNRTLALQTSLGSGSVLFLPVTLAGMRRDWPRAREALVRLVAALARARAGRVPRWVDRHVLPEEVDLRAELARLTAADAALRAARIAVDHRLAAQRRRRALTHARGDAFRDAAAEAFWSLGLHVLQGPEGEADLLIGDGIRTTLVLIAEGCAGPDDLDRLAEARRVAEAGYGLLLLNHAPDLTPPDRSSPAVPAELAARAAGVGIGLLTGLDLFAWQEAVARGGDAAAARAQFLGAGGGAPPDWRPFLAPAAGS